MLPQTRIKKHWDLWITELWDKIKNQVGAVSGGKPIEYGRDFMKIRFESDDDLPLGEILNISVCIIVAGSVFQEDNNYYPQVYLREMSMNMNYKGYAILVQYT